MKPIAIGALVETRSVLDGQEVPHGSSCFEVKKVPPTQDFQSFRNFDYTNRNIIHCPTTLSYEHKFQVYDAAYISPHNRFEEPIQAGSFIIWKIADASYDLGNMKKLNVHLALLQNISEGVTIEQIDDRLPTFNAYYQNRQQQQTKYEAKKRPLEPQLNDVVALKIPRVS